jgi:hypothetical protein
MALPASFHISKPTEKQSNPPPNFIATIISTPNKLMPEVDTG